MKKNLVLGLAILGCGSVMANSEVRMLSEAELKASLNQSRMEPRLAERVREVMNHVQVQNLRGQAAGDSSELKVMEYNAARGEHFDTLISLLTDCQDFARNKLNPEKAGKMNSAARAKFERQACRANSADIILFNELDYFMCRSGYQDVTYEIASRLQMNYAFSPEFLEIDPVQLGLKENKSMPQCSRPDFNRARQIHGNAILSKYPIRSARRVELTSCYDWYANEKNKGLGSLFKKSASQIRRGGRNAIIAEVEHPQGIVTVVSAHLENKTDGACRARQMNEVLDAVSNVRGPVILAGDLNTTGFNGSPNAAIGGAIGGSGGGWADIIGGALENTVTDESGVFGAIQSEGFDLSANDGRKTFIGKGGAALSRLDYLAVRGSCARAVRGETLDAVGEYGAVASDHLPIMMDVELSCR